MQIIGRHFIVTPHTFPLAVPPATPIINGLLGEDAPSAATKDAPLPDDSRRSNMLCFVIIPCKR